VSFVFSEWFLFMLDPLSFIVWFCSSMWSKVWCRLLHLWHICLEHVWPLKYGYKQLKHSPSCLARLARCLGCNLRNLSLLKILCDSSHRGHCNCVGTLQCVGLLTLAPADCRERGVIAVDFSDWVVWSNSKALHLDSRNVTNSAVVGVFVRDAMISSHSRCVSGSSVASIKWFNIKSWMGTFKDNAFNAFMWLETWLISWRNENASSPLTCGIWHKSCATCYLATLLPSEETSTLLAEIQSCLNSRPLCALSSDPLNPTYLSPEHFSW
jgi:hypothetical protein